jgi:hypothetical protein
VLSCLHVLQLMDGRNAILFGYNMALVMLLVGRCS